MHNAIERRLPLYLSSALTVFAAFCLLNYGRSGADANNHSCDTKIVRHKYFRVCQNLEWGEIHVLLENNQESIHYGQQLWYVVLDNYLLIGGMGTVEKPLAKIIDRTGQVIMDVPGLEFLDEINAFNLPIFGFSYTTQGIEYDVVIDLTGRTSKIFDSFSNSEDPSPSESD